MAVDISVIVPIYKGKQYISYWMETICKNATYLKTMNLQCELLLVNDWPEEQIKIENFQSNGFRLKILNSDENRGIHGARIYGLEHAEGKWIVFIDQDDLITDDYLLKQIMCIGDADAVICNAYMKYLCKDVKRILYSNSIMQNRTTDLSYYISTGNPICSPGQVIIKKEAIPALWCQRKLKTNGADDYFLWILMLKSGKKFMLNEGKLYTHVGTGSNVSDNFPLIECSIHEVEQILVENNLLDDTEKQIIKNRTIEGSNRHKSIDIIEMYDYWLYLEHRQQHISDFLQGKGLLKIGIYGMGSIGDRLCDVLSYSDIEIIFAIDKRADHIMCDIPIFRMEDACVEIYMRQVDAMIVTAESDFKSIKEKIAGKNCGISVFSFKCILLEMINYLC